MAIREDIWVDFSQNPRVIWVASPSTEITIQDLHDTLRDIEDEPHNLVFEHLIESAGKEELGGGVLVGITSTLQNAKVAFQARKIAVSSGIVTVADYTGRRLISSGSSFISNGVETGAWVLNISDKSLATVISIDSEYQITTDYLGGGSNNYFDVGDEYKIWNVEQVEISGGNLVAKNIVGEAVSSVLPTAGTQVVRTSASSATLQELSALQYASFAGGVTIDTTNGVSGLDFPTGTPQQPVNNLNDAMTIASERGFGTLYILGDIVVDNSGDYSNMVFVGESKSKSIINISTGANVYRAEFYDAHVTGILDGEAVIKDCIIDNLEYLSGYIERCILNPGTIILSGNSEAHFLDCWSGISGTGVPSIDLGGTGQSLAVRNYNGNLKLKNKTGTDDTSLDINSGEIELDSTVTNGTIYIRGVGNLIDNSVGATVIAEDLMNKQHIGDAVWDHSDGTNIISTTDFILALLQNKTITDPITGIMTIYDSDNITPLYTAQLYEDAAGSQTYRGQGAERRERLD